MFGQLGEGSIEGSQFCPHRSTVFPFLTGASVQSGRLLSGLARAEVLSDHATVEPARPGVVTTSLIPTHLCYLRPVAPLRFSPATALVQSFDCASSRVANRARSSDDNPCSAAASFARGSSCSLSGLQVQALVQAKGWL